MQTHEEQIKRSREEAQLASVNSRYQQEEQ